MAEEHSAVEIPHRGAMRDLADDASSRKRFLKMVGGAGAAGAFALFLAACGGDDEDEAADTGAGTQTQESGAGDLEVVNYALTLEFLEAAFYQRVLESGEITDRALVETVTLIGENEQEHVDALMATAKKLGEPAAEPETNFDDVIAGGRDMILQTAAQVENIGAAAYLGQAGNIQDKEILAAALAIHTVEGRHAAALNNVVGESFVPDGAFAVPMSMDEVLEAVQPFIAS